jgi:hypothetical protein
MIRDPATGLPAPRRLSATAPGDMAQVPTASFSRPLSGYSTAVWTRGKPPVTFSTSFKRTVTLPAAHQHLALWQQQRQQRSACLQSLPCRRLALPNVPPLPAAGGEA